MVDRIERIERIERIKSPQVPSELVRRQDWETGRLYKTKLVTVVGMLIWAALIDSGKWRKRKEGGQEWLERI